MNDATRGKELGRALNVLGAVVGCLLYCSIPAGILIGITWFVFDHPEVGVTIVAVVLVPLLAWSVYMGWTDPVRTRAERRAARADRARASEASAW